MWKQININVQNIKVDADKSILIKMPHNSKYDGYDFWHPKKLVRNGKHIYAVTISYMDNFEFRLKKYGKGKTNFTKVLDEITISAAEFEKEFQIMDENIREPEANNNSYLIVQEPKKIEVVKVEVPDCLKNN